VEILAQSVGSSLACMFCFHRIQEIGTSIRIVHKISRPAPLLILGRHLHSLLTCSTARVQQPAQGYGNERVQDWHFYWPIYDA
jgi:hypothetical protein